MKKYILSLILSFLGFYQFALAQPSTSIEKVEMADAMRSDGKIWVVVVSLSVVLIILLIYLFVTDRKIKKMEEKIFKQKNYIS